MATQQPVLYMPTRAVIEALKPGDLVLNCFGKWVKIVDITARREDIHGKLFICFTAEFGPNSTMSGSYKEGELVRTVGLTSLHTSDELDRIERKLQGELRRETLQA